jgi:hypothetical protein
MSLLQEIEKHGLADCEFNRQLAGFIDDYELINFIDENGIALDDSLNEFRNENGEIVIIPELDRQYFKQVKRG